MSESRLGHRSSLHRRSGRVMGGLDIWREIHWYHVFLCSISVAFGRWSRKGASCLEAPKRYPEPHPLSLPPPPPGNGNRSSASFGWRRTGNTRSDVKRKCRPSAPLEHRGLPYQAAGFGTGTVPATRDLEVSPGTYADEWGKQGLPATCYVEHALAVCCIRVCHFPVTLTLRLPTRPFNTGPSPKVGMERTPCHVDTWTKSMTASF